MAKCKHAKSYERGSKNDNIGLEDISSQKMILLVLYLLGFEPLRYKLSNLHALLRNYEGEETA